jgi:hypothetical protein
MTRARSLSQLANSNVFSVDANNSRVGIGSTIPDAKLDVGGDIVVGTAITIGSVSGIISATDFYVDGISITGAAGTWATFTSGGEGGISTTKKVKIENGLEVTGISTFSSDLTVAGQLTYEDVTNVDSIGIITARSYVSIADSIVHTGDTDTSIRFPAADTFTVETAGEERLRITSAGITTVSGSFAIPAVPGTDTNTALPVLFQTSGGVIDGGSGLTYNPGGDNLSVNGNFINSNVFRGAGNSATLSAADSSSTSFFQIDGGVPKISMATDKVIQFSASIGEIGNVTGFQATNTAASSNTDFGIRATTIRFATGNSERCRVTDDGFMPDSDNARDLGSTSLRWANIYSADLQLSNEGSVNDVDGTWGQYTIQEGENDLFLLNRRNGKTYKFVLEEV